jgi:hypothetical protein
MNGALQEGPQSARKSAAAPTAKVSLPTRILPAPNQRKGDAATSAGADQRRRD